MEVQPQKSHKVRNWIIGIIGAMILFSWLNKQMPDYKEPQENATVETKQEETSKPVEKPVITKDARAAYIKELRNQFLDNGWDINVKVEGKNSEKLRLSYVLFNDVWFRKFETSKLFEKWQQMGFSEITLSDEADYYKGVRTAK